MTYRTLMVHLELGGSNAGLLQTTGDLAARFGARVVGIAASQAMQMMYVSDGFGYARGSFAEIDRGEIDKELKTAEAQFHSVLAPYASRLEWRSTVMYAPVSDFIAREARCADLVITGAGHGAKPFEASTRGNIGDLVMRAGRPVLVVPAGVSDFSIRRMIVAWKDTREARRAVFDALPILKLAGHISLVEIASSADFEGVRLRLEDVASWLRQHGVETDTIAPPSTGYDTWLQLSAIVRDDAADLVIAGAYGHSRLREWAFGGVTRDLLLHSKTRSFLSH